MTAEYNRVLTPAEVEAALIDAVNEVSRGIEVTTERLQTFREADHQFDLAWARAYLAAEGTIDERKAHCILATEDARRARDISESAYRYADRRTKSAEARLSAFQTLTRSVTAAFNAAGAGT